ncbi:MAG: hypothetical protein AAB555_02365 [Patescibacteria group bacterium]
MTIAGQVTEPPVPVAVPMYVVVVVGETDTVLDATGVEVPMPLSIKNKVAFAVVHESTEEEPLLIVEGFAESVHTGGGGGGGGGVTTIAAAQVTEPPAPVAVPVYVVVAVGETDMVLDATGVTSPMLLSILKVETFVVVQERVEEVPV